MFASLILYYFLVWSQKKRWKNNEKIVKQNLLQSNKHTEIEVAPWMAMLLLRTNVLIQVQLLTIGKIYFVVTFLEVPILFYNWKAANNCPKIITLFMHHKAM